MSLVRIRLRYVRADGSSVQIIGWWPSTAAATLTAEADGAVSYVALVLSDLRADACVEQNTSHHPLDTLHINRGSMDAAADAYEAEYNDAHKSSWQSLHA